MRKGLTTPEDINAMKVELYKAEHNIKAPPVKGKKSKGRRATEFVLMGAMVLFTVVFVLYATIFNIDDKPIAIFSHYLYNVETASMNPTLAVGDKIVSKQVDEDTVLAKGNIITFITDDGLRVTHRIVQVITTTDGEIVYKTKGDNPVNSVDDWVLTRSQIEAVFKFRIPTLRDIL